MSAYSGPGRTLPPNAPKAERPVRHLNQIDLSRRWSISPRTLERWRWLKAGPPYLKIGGRVGYRIEDVEGYEAGQLHLVGSTSGQGRRS
jgi:hypothetical protein